MRKLIGWQGVVASALVCRGETSIVTRYTLSVKLLGCISATEPTLGEFANEIRRPLPKCIHSHRNYPRFQGVGPAP